MQNFLNVKVGTMEKTKKLLHIVNVETKKFLH